VPSQDTDWIVYNLRDRLFDPRNEGSGTLSHAVTEEGLAEGTREEVDVVVVGAGFAGLYALYRLRELGLRVRVFEAGDDVGGTWYWNRYAGARCDTNSLFYCYSFSDELRSEWTWTERYPSRSELLAYLRHVADRFDLHRDITFAQRITRAEYDEAANRWSAWTHKGERIGARFLVTAVGCLSDLQVPAFPGLDSFAGEYYHTARWPDPPPDFRGRRVGVIGTGSSGVQVIPEVAREALHLTVFQRTPNYVLPARNAPLDPETVSRTYANYPSLRQRIRQSSSGLPLENPTRKAMEVSPDERERIYQERWDRGGVAEFLLAFSDVRNDLAANQTAAEFIRSKIRAIVKDPATAELLCPKLHFGAKRTPLGTDYYETFNRENVELVDVSDPPITAIDRDGVWVGDRHHPLTQLVFATGFDAMTGPLLKMDIRGTCGQSLRDRWAKGPRTYLGLAASGFPNLFMLTGPGSPSVLGNVVVAIEQHVEWVTELLRYVERHGIEYVEARRDAEDRWVEHVNDVGSRSIISTGNSWYLGANIPGKPRVFLPYAGGYDKYRGICDALARNGYQGFELATSSDPERAAIAAEG
jgi:cyclohexanone monooxygenase